MLRLMLIVLLWARVLVADPFQHSIFVANVFHSADSFEETKAQKKYLYELIYEKILEYRYVQVYVNALRGEVPSEFVTKAEMDFGGRVRIVPHMGDPHYDVSKLPNVNEAYFLHPERDVMLMKTMYGARNFRDKAQRIFIDTEFGSQLENNFTFKKAKLVKTQQQAIASVSGRTSVRYLVPSETHEAQIRKSRIEDRKRSGIVSQCLH